VRFDRPGDPDRIFHSQPQFLEELVAEPEPFGEERLHVLQGGDAPDLKPIPDGQEAGVARKPVAFLLPEAGCFPKETHSLTR